MLETQKFKFIENGKTVLIDRERWCWGVLYKDNTELHQFDDNGNFHQLAEIDQKEVKLWVLYKPDDPHKRIDFVVPEGARLIHKYRNVRPAHLDYFIKVYMFGYRTGKNENDFKYHFNFILPDDRVVQSTVDNIDLTLLNLEF